ncbi:hypothetical protein [Delftia sp. PE138]|uniref:hypothetical protein n=1 Tax=Delftia sp. PE138 TaxID=1812483 RepID=UPI001BB02F9A|nr:hypothetical protein [Delftia sp. PE138]MBS3723401.1 hypothetical protein [Delftia sp. PE138]
MTVENAQFINQLNTAWPLSSDMVSEGDDHIRVSKLASKQSFPNVGGAVSASHIELSYVTGVTSSIQAQINTKGAIAGQTWSGTHIFPNTTTVGPLTPTIQGYLSTATSDIQVQINGKGAISGQTWSGGQNFTGATVTVPTRLTGDNTQNAASTAFVQATATALDNDVQTRLDAKGNIAGQVWQNAHDFRPGSLLAPTRVTGDATENVATTAFVAAAALATALPGQTGNARKFVTTDGTNASWAYPFPSYLAVSGTSATATLGSLHGLQNASATTLTLPASPANGDIVGIRAENLRIDNVINRNGNLLMGLAENMTIDNPYFPIVLQFQTGYGWRLVA